MFGIASLAYQQSPASSPAEAASDAEAVAL